MLEMTKEQVEGLYQELNARNQELQHWIDQNLLLVQKVDDLNGEISQLKRSNQLRNETTKMMEIMLKASY